MNRGPDLAPLAREGAAAPSRPCELRDMTCALGNVSRYGMGHSLPEHRRLLELTNRPNGRYADL